MLLIIVVHRASEPWVSCGGHSTRNLVAGAFLLFGLYTKMYSQFLFPDFIVIAVYLLKISFTKPLPLMEVNITSLSSSNKKIL